MTLIDLRDAIGCALMVCVIMLLAKALGGP